ncbi:kinase-like protein, partial [Rhizophagus irregularis]
MGMIAYIDPKRLEDYFYEYNDKSDIYSLGVLMWEISSGRPPFADRNISDSLLKTDLIDGRREEPVSDTPNEYLKLYKSCWDLEPNKRPSIRQVFNKLVELGKAMNIQDFQDINCDNDDMQGIQDVQDIQDDNDNDTDAQEANVNVEADDINNDLD